MISIKITIIDFFRIYCEEKYPNPEFFLLRISLHSDWIQENTDQKKLRICTLFKAVMYRRQLAKRANLKSGVTRKQSTPKSPKKEHFLGVRNVRFSENMWCFVFLLFPFWDLPFSLITDELCFCEQIFLTSRFLFLNKVLLFWNLTLRATIQQVTFALTIQDMVYTKKPLQTLLSLHWTIFILLHMSACKKLIKIFA